MLRALKLHWPEYLMEAGGLGLFMASACGFSVLLEHPASTVHRALDHPLLRRLLMGLAMGVTSILLVFSPWGKRSGAHFNPSLTLTYFRLGKVERWDALFYTLFQFAGGLAGVLLSALVLRSLLADPAVNYVATVPGARGVGVAFATEVLISGALMTVVLAASSGPLARFTGLFAGAVVAANITLAAPLSGMSMNPARTFASALPAQAWTGIWIYFTAPLLGMLLAAQLFLWTRGPKAISCAKLHHQNRKRCIFCARPASNTSVNGVFIRQVAGAPDQQGLQSRGAS